MNSISERLLKEQNECVLSWVKADGSPAATVVSFVYLEEKIWMTALLHSARVKAITRNPRVSVTISGKGTALGHSRCVSIQGICQISTDENLRNAFFPAFSQAVLPNSAKGAAMMEQMMNTADNAVLIVEPQKIIPYDAHDMLEAADSY